MRPVLGSGVFNSDGELMLRLGLLPALISRVKGIYGSALFTSLYESSNG